MENTPSSRPASPKVKTDDYSDNGKPDTVEQLTSEIDVLAADDKPRQTPIDPSPVTSTGGLYDLWRTLDKIDHGDDWEGLRVAENAKANDEAIVHKNNGRVRLFPKTETTKENCIALLMDSYNFRHISINVCHYVDHQTAFNKIRGEKDEVVKQNKNLKLDIRDREKELHRLQASGPTAAATWRCRRQLDELHVRLSSAEHRISALKTLQEVEQLEITAWRQFTTESLIEILEEANLMPPCKGDPEQSKHDYIKEGWPSPTITSPTAPNPFVTSPSATSPSY